MSNKAIVTIPNNSIRPERDLIHNGDDRYSLIYHASVWTSAGEEEHLIVCTLPHSISQAECETIRGNLRKTNAKAIISFYIADRVGRAQVITAPDEEFKPFNLASAIAVTKASCGWEESSSIMVMINSDEVRVWPRFNGRRWLVEDGKETNYEGLS